ncbi:branched-chain amino acid ABC transporter permease [Puniceibacterium sp. HSS470]|jgi:branched-chain amino acid transport system permease protein|nr:branched-chain amino acid ABC transporter permease [Puniceibacterium sp. HSS470]|tara:strand:+ start:37084 stop:37947 length:864 start_codon:yes stop_codon:yes gene_type:complete
MTTVLSLGMDALAYAMILFIISVGLSLSLGLMRVINLAHGAFAMIGGYIAAYIGTSLGLPYVIAILAGVAGTVVIGLPLERLLYRRIYGSSEMAQILLTIGLTFVIIGGANFLFGPTLKTIALPDTLRQSADLGFRAISYNRLFVIFCGAVVAFGLWLLIERTGFGVRLRATVDNSEMASALGVPTNRVYSIAFALATALAAFGGIIGAELLPIEPYYALTYLVTILVVVCVGGSGSIIGVLVASLILGSVDTAARYYLPSYGAFFFYSVVIVIIMVLPNGLMGRRA